MSHSYVTFKPEVAANNIVRGYTVTEMIRADTAGARIRELEEAISEVVGGFVHIYDVNDHLRRALNREETE